MELPAKVFVNCPVLTLTNTAAILLSISPHGYFELQIDYPNRGRYTALAPIAQTGIIFAEPLVQVEMEPGVQRY